MHSKSRETEYINKSLDKALTMIELFNSDTEKLSVTAISKKLGVTPGTVYPTLYTLEKHGYLNRDDNKKYSLGLKFLEKGSLILEKMDLRAQAHPELEKLRDETNETVHLGVLSDGEVIYIDKLEPQRTIRMYSSIGKRAPAHTTALGKSILAHLTKDKLDHIVAEKGLPQYTQKTITSIAKLEKELEKIRKRGYTIDDAEHEKEIRCVACPIFKHTGKVVAAASLTIPAFRANREEIEDFAPLVKKYTTRISQKLGYTPE